MPAPHRIAIKQYDMYKRFIRWASDRLDGRRHHCVHHKQGVHRFKIQDDGFQESHTAEEFNDVYG